MRPAIAPYGTWPSSVDPGLAPAQNAAYLELRVDGDRLTWLQALPGDGGRTSLLAWRPGGTPQRVSPPRASVGDRVHEYGGGAYAARDGVVVASERTDGSVWLDTGTGPRTLVAVPGCRYADFELDLPRRRAYAVREDHRDRPPTAPANEIVALHLDAADPAANAGAVVAGGTDFVASPRLSPDGRTLAWIGWNLPAMAHQRSGLFVAAFDDAGRLGAPSAVVDEPGVSVAQVAWGPDGTLCFCSDRSGWWNVYARRGEAFVALAPVDAEIGAPLWVFGTRLIAPRADGSVLCAYTRDAAWLAGEIRDGALTPLPLGRVAAAPQPFGDGLAAVVAPADGPPAIVAGGEVVSRRDDLALAPADVSIAEPLVVRGDDGGPVHAFSYPPRSERFTGPPGARPPLIVMSHGGPTAMQSDAFDVAVQAWTNRGFAVAHVNYRGSSGFGRAYRDALDGAWCDLDVRDCIAVARALIEGGKVDPARVAIRGSSASGATALLALARAPLFAAAASSYGVTDLTLLAQETHKFESGYLDGLIGPYPAERERYRERSPVTHVDAIAAPVIVFQGLEDRVVPPTQAEAFVDAMRARGVDVEYHTFPGEGHGFRDPANRRAAFERELAFYRRVMHLEAA